MDLIREWEGHKSNTRDALLEVLTTATTGAARISRADRVLFTACEFWAAANNGALQSLFADDATEQLRAAEAAFTIVGLAQVALILRNGRRALTESDRPATVQQVAESIEAVLCDLGDVVDQRLAEFADQRAQDRGAQDRGLQSK